MSLVEGETGKYCYIGEMVDGWPLDFTMQLCVQAEEVHINLYILLYVVERFHRILQLSLLWNCPKNSSKFYSFSLEKYSCYIHARIAGMVVVKYYQVGRGLVAVETAVSQTHWWDCGPCSSELCCVASPDQAPAEQ